MELNEETMDFLNCAMHYKRQTDNVLFHTKSHLLLHPIKNKPDFNEF